MNARKELKKLLFRHEFAFRHLDWLMQFYSVHVRDRLADAFTLVNYHVLRRKPASSQASFPSQLTITPTNYCNAKCVFCAYPRMRQEHSALQLGQFTALIDEFASLGGTTALFAPTLGEVFFDPTLFEKLAHCKARGLYVKLVTNGFQLNFRDNYRKLACSGIDEVFVSVGDVVPGRDAIVFGVSEAMSKRKLDGIGSLLRAMEEAGSAFDLCMLMRPQRRFGEVLDDMKRTALWDYYSKGRIKIHWMHAYDTWSGAIEQADLGGIQRVRVGSRVKKYPCRFLNELSILPTGHVRLCGCRVKDTFQDELVVGHVGESSLLGIWQSEARERVIAAFGRGELPEVCKDCTFYEPKMGN